MKSTPPAVSWILPVHKLQRDVYDAIDSCIFQSFTSFELLIIVNGPDSYRMQSVLISRYCTDSRVRIFATDIVGISFSLNLGLHKARASLIARMDSDDMAANDRLAIQVNHMLDNPDLVLLGSYSHIIDSSGRVIGNKEVPLADAAIKSALVFANVFIHPSVIYRRDAVVGIGGYRGFMHCEDYDLWIRLMLADKGKFANLPLPIIGYRSHGIGTSRNALSAYLNCSFIQFSVFLRTLNPTWLIASILTSLKLIFRLISP